MNDHRDKSTSAVPPNASQSVAEALVQCLAGTANTAQTARKHRAEVDWNAVADLADADGVSGLLFKRLQNAPADAAKPPADVMKRLGGRYLAAAGHNARLYHELAALSAELHEHNVELIVLKGAHLAKCVYGDIGVRGMCDLDLLLHRGADLHAAERALSARGYALARPEQREKYETEHFHVIYAKGAVHIELHWNVIAPAHPLAGMLGDLWQRSRPTPELGSPNVRTFAPHDLLLHLCVHMACEHGLLLTLRPLCDIAEALRHYAAEVDWDILSRSAELGRVRRSVNACLLLASDMLGAPLPDVFRRAAEADSFAPDALETMRRYILTTPPHAELDVPIGLAHAMRAGKRLGRARALLASVFPPPAEMRKIYRLRSPGALLLPLCYVWRPLDLLHRKGRDTLRIMLGTPEARAAISRERDKAQIDAWLAQEQHS